MKNITMDPDATRLLEWIRGNAGYIHRDLYINSSVVDGKINRNIYYENKNNIKTGDDITKIPFELAISERTFLDIPGIGNWINFIKSDKPELNPVLKSNRFQIIVALLHETLKGENSFYFPFINLFPTHSYFDSHPISIYYKNKNTLRILEEISASFLKKADAACSELSLIIDTIQLCNHKYELLNPTIQSDTKFSELIKWAYFIHLTRSWGDYLIPFHCFFNHSNNSSMSHASGSSGASNHLSFKADKQFEVTGDSSEVFYNYSQYDAMSLYMTYDFLYEYGEEKKYLPLPFGLRNTPDLNRRKSNEIDKCKINTKKIFICNEGPPRNLLSTLRIASMTEDECTRLSQNRDIHKYSRPISCGNEIRSLSLLLKIVLDLKKTTYTNSNLSIIRNTLKHHQGKALSASEHVIETVCTIALSEHDILNESLHWISTLLQHSIQNARIEN